MDLPGIHPPTHRLPLVELLLAMTILVNPLLAQQSQNALFNGKNLDGWKHVGPGSLVVEAGMMKTEGGMGLLWYSRKKVGDATLRVVFKLTGKESDSGVFIRIPETAVMKSRSATGRTITHALACSTHSQKPWRVQSEHSANGIRWR